MATGLPGAQIESQMTAAMPRWVYYTGKTAHTTNGSRSAITTALKNGYAVCFDPLGWDKGKGVDVTRPQTSTVNNLSLFAGVITNVKAGTNAAGWVQIIPYQRGTTVTAWVKADCTSAHGTPVYLGPAADQFELAAKSTVNSADTIKQVVARALATDDFSSTAGTMLVAFV